MPALEQGELPGVAVVLDLHGLLSPGDFPAPPAGRDRGDDREHGRDGQRRPPVADPVHVLVAAVPEHLRIRAAAVEPHHDRRARRRGLPQLRQDDLLEVRASPLGVSLSEAFFDTAAVER